MLVLKRNSGESIRIGTTIKLSVLSVQGKQIKIGIEAPKKLTVHRLEVYTRVKAEKKTVLSDKAQWVNGS